MADLGGTFDATAKENNQANCLPAGTYPAVLVKSDRPEGKNYLYCEFQIAAGEFQNRRVIHRFNLWHEKQDVVQIARGQFSQFCRATGVLTPKDSTELELKPVLLTLNTKESADYGLQNNVTKFAAKQSTPAPAPAATTTEAGAAW